MIMNLANKNARLPKKHKTEILVHQKFWSGGTKFLENWSAGPENFGTRVELAMV